MTKMDVDINIGKRIKLRRTMLGLSQIDIANSLKMTFQQIQKYEKGINSLNSGKLHDFSILLKVPISYFFEELENDPKIEEKIEQNSLHSFSSDRESLEMMKAFKKIKQPHLRKKMIEILHALTYTEKS